MGVNKKTPQPTFTYQREKNLVKPTSTVEPK